MKGIFRISGLSVVPLTASAVNVKGPDGYAVGVVLLLLIMPVAIYFFANWLRNRGKTSSGKQKTVKRKKYTISLEKNKLYYPDYLILKVTNSGNCDVDLDRPLLCFSNFWRKRNFRLKGTNHYHFYPLLLEPGKTHDLTVDLGPFYRHDKRLKHFPRITLSVNEVNSTRVVSQSVMLRKTLLR